jgi:uncharacterized lipoprotein NlpE involved in copper resistance
MNTNQIRMTKIGIFAAIIISLYGCGSNDSQTKTQSVKQDEETKIDMHNAQISLDYEGTYIGNLPAASDIDMTITIILKNDTYLMKTEYSGKADVFENKGSYTWNEGGDIITLHGISDAPNQYFVGENTLTQLDMDGSFITGKLADQYILQKKFE